MDYLHSKQPLVTGDMCHYKEPKENNCVRFTEDIEEKHCSIRYCTIEDIDKYRLTFTEVTARQCMSYGMSMNKSKDF